jgi:hypothetical protein
MITLTTPGKGNDALGTNMRGMKGTCTAHSKKVVLRRVLWAVLDVYLSEDI